MPPYYAGIAGAGACTARRCDLARGHRDRRRGADDHGPPPAAGCRVHRQARRPARRRAPRAHAALDDSRDAPAGHRPLHASPRSRPGAACGWCATRAFAPGPTRHAPTASPTRSTSRSRAASRAQIAAVQHDRADAVVTSGDFAAAVPLDRAARARARRRQPRATAARRRRTSWLFLNVRVPAVRRRSRPPRPQLRDRSPAHRRARGRRRPRGPVLPADPARAARLRAGLPVHPRRDAGRRLVGA